MANAIVLLFNKGVSKLKKIVKVIVFTLNEQTYAVSLQQILSIERMQTITTIPRTSENLKGIIHLRDKTIPIIDLKKRLFNESTEITTDSRILISNVKDIYVGFIVDSADEVIDVDTTSIEPPPEVIGNDEDTFLKGVVNVKDEIVVLFDLKQTLLIDEINEFQKNEQLYGTARDG